MVMLFSEQLNYYTTIEKVFQVLQYFTEAVILRRARIFAVHFLNAFWHGNEALPKGSS